MINECRRKEVKYIKPTKECDKWAFDLLADVTKRFHKYNKRPLLQIRKTHINGHGWFRDSMWRVRPLISLSFRDGELGETDSHKSLLLHEIAHFLTPRHDHDKVFYKMCFKLFKLYNIPEKEYETEFDYKERSKAIYMKMKGLKPVSEYNWVRADCPECGAGQMTKVPKENTESIVLNHLGYGPYRQMNKRNEDGSVTISQIKLYEHIAYFMDKGNKGSKRLTLLPREGWVPPQN